MKSLFNFARSLKNNLETFSSALRQGFADDEELKPVLEDLLERETLPITKWLHVYNFIDPDSTAEVQQVNTTLQSWQDEYPSYYTAFQKVLEGITTRYLPIRWSIKFIATIFGYSFNMHISIRPRDVRRIPDDAYLNLLSGENAYTPLPTGDDDSNPGGAVSGSRLKLIAREQKDSVLATWRTILTDFTDAARSSNHDEDGTASASTGCRSILCE
eukprot:gene29249-38750_t